MTPGAGPAGELEARMSKYDNDDEYLQLMAAARKKPSDHPVVGGQEEQPDEQFLAFARHNGTERLYLY